MPSSPTTVVISYTALPGKGPAARAALAALLAVVLAKEPDCHDITLLQGAADDTRFLLYETWTSHAAYAGPHMQTPHIQAFKEGARSLFAGPPDITFWKAEAMAAG
jgi:quinol monooxygenase YgiN